MRATDAVMRRYYRTTVGVEPKLKFRNWGAYVKNLRNCPRADQKIVNFLDQIRDNYRNRKRDFLAVLTKSGFRAG